MREAREGCELLIAGGGDGTVNLIVNAIAGTDATLGILPLGTANDFAQHLGIPRHPGEAARRIVAGRVRRYDVVAVNGRRFCTVGGVGLVTECAQDANRLKSGGQPLRALARGLGSSIYPVVAVAKILFGERRHWEAKLVWCDPRNETLPALTAPVHAMFFANQAIFGGGVTLPVDACNQDGNVEICVVGPASRLRLLRILIALRLARPIDRKLMPVHRATRVRIELARDAGFLGDGEVLGVGRHFELEVLAGALPVVG